jgi:two-component system, NarL family, response regulator
MPQKIRVYFVDDHPLLRDGLAAIVGVQKDMTVAGQADSAEAALSDLENSAVDVVLVDLRLPGMSGIELILRLRDRHPASRVIVLSSHGGDENIYRSLSAGALAYLLKDTLRTELLDAIRTVFRGERYVTRAVAAKLAGRDSYGELTPRETEILKLIVKGRSNREIAGEINVSEGTVRIHVSNVLAKLGVEDRTKAAVQAIERGIVHL